MCAQSSLSVQPYKGTRDFYPPEMRNRLWMFDKLRRVLARFGYEEYDGPMLEPFELYAAKTSEEIVNEQLYSLVDRGERKLAIRPEMTPTLARMVAAKQNELARPIRWFSIPNLWRYERPQRGRLREHWQLNVDLFGGGSSASGANDESSDRGAALELCQVIVAIMAEFGARDGFEVRLNHRGLTNYLFEQVLGVSSEQTQAVARFLDGAAKTGRDGFLKQLHSLALSEQQVALLVELVFEAETFSDRLNSLFKDAAPYAEVSGLLKNLTDLGIAQYFRLDPSIMRGFQYYTGLVFEVYDLHPSNTRALFGGGKYDNLVGMFGGHPLPGIGFGMGDVTFAQFLEVRGLLPNWGTKRGLYLAALDTAATLPAHRLASALRQWSSDQGRTHPTVPSLQPDKPKKAFQTAERLGMQYIAFIGSQELADGIIEVKDLTTGEKRSVSVDWNAVTVFPGAWDFLNYE